MSVVESPVERPVLTIQEWRAAQMAGGGLDRILAVVRSQRDTRSNAWISLASDDEIGRQWEELERAQAEEQQPLPLFGVPFAAKDNIDAVGFLTTAACPAFASGPAQSDAVVVGRLKAAGAILIGKTNMDQFATGLVGTRTPYGAVANAFDPRRISGGSSSGSALVVSKVVVPFSLGTDTAGSGRVPAGLNNVVGVKPTRGAISTTGVLPACRTLDCVSIFALTVSDAELVLSLAEGHDPRDAYSRTRPPAEKKSSNPRPWQKHPSVAICHDAQWYGSTCRQEAYEAALNCARRQGFALEPVDFSDLFELADLLYQGPWVAERYAAIRDMMQSRPGDVHPVVRDIILQADKFHAADVFEAEYRRQSLTSKIRSDFARFDAVLVPTAPTFPTLDDVAKEPVRENSVLGRYTNFVNFLDWSAVAIPAGFATDGLPFGVTLLSTAWQEPKLMALAKMLHSASDRRLGVSEVLHQEPRVAMASATTSAVGDDDDDWMELAVVGAHMRGFPLNQDLVSRAATFVRTARTSSQYRLYALAALSQGRVRKPGLVRTRRGETGRAIELEVWRFPTVRLADFIRTIPSPLGLGSLELENGSWMCGFICEPSGLEGAVDISQYSGWRNYCALPEANVVSEARKPIHTILIANRGEIAVRIINTIRKMRLRSVAMYSAADARAMHVQRADASFPLAGDTVADTYLCVDKILAIAQKSGADAVIPGYGFLAENADFASRVESAGLVWIGPTPTQMRDMGLKHRARQIAEAVHVPTVPGTQLLADVDEALAQAREMGYPVMVKSTAGGGGIGMRVARDPESLRTELQSVQQTASANFGNAAVFIERFVERARHVEVQIVGDGKGTAMAVGDRDCSLQRRHQKVVEECPAVFVPRETRREMCSAAVALASHVQYRSIGTVEFIYDMDRAAFHFLEMNTRLQVEHAVTEEVHGLDLVEAMIDIARGRLDVAAPRVLGDEDLFSVEARIYAESPLQNFQPLPGRLLRVEFPDNVRVETGFQSGSDVSSSYDPLLAKLVATADSRQAAVDKLLRALRSTVITGVETNLDYLAQVVASKHFSSGDFTTTTLDALDAFAFAANAVEVVEAGSSTSIQDYPGRGGYWHVGIPPSGPMDDYSFRLANRLVGDDDDRCAALECAAEGPTLLFHSPCVVAVAGAPVDVVLDGCIIDSTKAFAVQKGQTLSTRHPKRGYRHYIAFSGGLLVPEILGSKSTFVLGRFGGHNGRVLRTGDLLRPGRLEARSSVSPPPPVSMPLTPIPDGDGAKWSVAVVPGPHGFPDYFSREGYVQLFSALWTVHYNSNRSGVRLKGPRPQWNRQDGGLAGLHPSNIHDSPYAMGSVSFTGDEAVVLTRDGPSLGGFVVFATIVQAELWKFGQMRPQDRVQLVPVTSAWAREQLVRMETCIEQLSPLSSEPSPRPSDLVPLADLAEYQEYPQLVRIPGGIVCRPYGQGNMLLEFGARDGFDLRQTFRILALVQRHEQHPFPHVQEMTPGVRTLLVTYAAQTELDSVMQAIQSELQHSELPTEMASRELLMPFVFDDAVSQAAVDRYAATIRKTAPYLPSNVDFLRRLNSLGADNSALQTILESATFLVLGLGDVFMASPCAVPLDPRHRLLGTKYNPSRSFTPRNSVGIGGQYMCIYATDSPGGYQLVGRTAPIWTERHVSAPRTPWLFQFLDRINFYPVPTSTLDEAINNETWHDLIHIKQGSISLAQHEKWLLENQSDMDRVTTQRVQNVRNLDFYQALLTPFVEDDAPRTHQTRPHPAGKEIRAKIPGRCFRITLEQGQEINAGDVVAWVESNKMEIKICSPVRGKCIQVCAEVGTILGAEDVIAVIDGNQD